MLAVGIAGVGLFLLDGVWNWGMEESAEFEIFGNTAVVTQSGGTGKEAVADQADCRSLPVVMYHSVVEDSSKAGPYVITVKELERDLQWIRDNGYVTVLMEDLIGFVNGEGNLPEKPFLITFDDGNYNNLYYVLPLLEQYGMKAVISAVGVYADQAEVAMARPEVDGGGKQNPDYDYLTWAEIKELDESPLVEIQNHTYDLHEYGARRGSEKMKGEREADYIAMLAEDLSRMQNALFENAGVQATTFTYPYGIISPESLDVVKALGFQASLSCYEKKNMIRKGDADCLYLLNRYNRPSSVNTDRFMKKLTGEGEP